MRRVAIGITILTTIYLYMNGAPQTSIKTTPVHLQGAGIRSPVNMALYIMPFIKMQNQIEEPLRHAEIQRVEIEKAGTVVKSSRMRMRMLQCMMRQCYIQASSLAIILSLKFLLTTPPTPNAGTILHMRAKLLVSQSVLTLAKRCLRVVSPLRL